jgi:cellulose synthase/poly-beta-1,6-N-acetylglucosamine synthase-like glycosyltransferase
MADLTPMIQREPNTATQLFSIVIPVYNDWIPLEQCLRSLARQTNAPDYEVIVVDDGSRESAPEYVRSFAHSYALTVIRQPHRGISAARNQGIQVSKGAILLFVDADCRLQSHCLTALSSAISQSRQQDSFQLRLVGNCSSLVGRAEQLRLSTFQDYMLQSDGSIRYLNTAGFAIRRRGVDVTTGLFEPVALRAEDTLLLANLIRRGQLPLFVPDAIVEHAIPLSLLQCVRKDIRSVALQERAYGIIAAKGVRIRITHRERLRLLVSMWKAAGRNSIGRSAWFVLMVRQALQRGTSLIYRYLRLGPTADVTTP